MSLLNAPALWLALLAIPIVLLYLLRLRRRERIISSTLLWQQVLLDREANTLWQRLRRNVLLLLQLLTLALLVLALSRPYVETAGALRGRHIVLLDASASMQATDVQPSRFEAARAQVRQMIEQLGPGSALSVIVVDHAPRALTPPTNDTGELLSALADAQPSLSSANWSAAIALAQAMAGGDSAQITVVGDGAGDIDEAGAASPLALLDGAARFIPVGLSGDNLAVANVSLRRTAGGLAALVQIDNSGEQARDALVSVRVDGVLANARTITVPAGASATWTVTGLDLRATSVHATLQAEAGNWLAVDDAAYAVHAARRMRRALLLSRGNLFLEQALRLLPELEVTRAVTPPVLPPSGQEFSFDLFIVDGVSITLPPQAHALYIGDAAPFTVTGQFSNTAYVRTEAHPIVESVDWRPVHILSANLLDSPDWLKPIVQAQGGPVLYAGQRLDTPLSAPYASGRVVVIPFVLQQSDLPLHIAFPVLMANAIEWLAPAQGADIPLSVHPGQVIPLPPNSAVQRPDGAVVIVGEQGFAETMQPGIYRVALNNGQMTSERAFAVNFFNRAESNIAPRLPAHAGAADPASDEAGAEIAAHELWRWLAAMALLVLIAEWWIDQRGAPTLNLPRAGRTPKT
ncbi:MAG: VWA domain-containing protein [Anaerolineae bacterium]|nr:VWA domain-containing protein [Thermoflexales bacterium]MDW8408101.1 VWA domain-containing protein [Anaerolineae bacterium]